ncbi:MAG TPA: outer membrane beta-barrel protein [Gemmatimonadaceae bacterium]|jgi:outer membrane protein with beta-barrel domain|nr:outer membrane beta-barrel protein [Gemmatimonadaceae bacterium]
MRNSNRLPIIARSIATALAFTAIAAPLAAQAPESGKVLHVSPYVGYMVFGDYLKGPVGTSLSNAPGAVYGTQVGLSLAPNLSLVGNLGYSASDIKIGVPLLGGVSVGHSSLLLYDANLEYDLGTAKGGAATFTPFVQAGAGAMRYKVDESILTTNATNFAGNVGLGADFAIGRGMALRVLAKDYIGKFNFKDATGLGINGETAHNLAFTAGLRFDF